jgi:hypothetical protein
MTQYLLSVTTIFCSIRCDNPNDGSAFAVKTMDVIRRLVIC